MHQYTLKLKAPISFEWCRTVSFFTKWTLPTIQQRRVALDTLVNQMARKGAHSDPFWVKPVLSRPLGATEHVVVPEETPTVFALINT